MQLLYSTTSPYARKLRVVMAELGLESQVELVPVVVMEDPVLLSNANPLIKVPTLITGPGPLESIFDSPVIAAYLLSLDASQKLLPPSGAAHWQALTIEALCDGILDAALSLRFEAAAGGTDRLPFWADRMRRSITGAVRALPARLAQIDDNFSYAIACVVVAVEYLDFRFPEMDWRGFAPELDALHKRWGDRPSLANTRPA